MSKIESRPKMKLFWNLVLVFNVHLLGVSSQSLKAPNSVSGSLIYESVNQQSSSQLSSMTPRGLAAPGFGTGLSTGLSGLAARQNVNNGLRHSGLQFKRGKRDPGMYQKMQTCVRNSFFPDSVNLNEPGVKCAIGAARKVLRVHERLKCKNCTPFFYCVTMARVHGDCGHRPRARSTASAIVACQDVQAIFGDTSSGKLDEASEGGRFGGEDFCITNFLCSKGCRFNQGNNNTCTATCH